MKLVPADSPAAKLAEIREDFDDHAWQPVHLKEPAAATPAGKSAVYRASLSVSQDRLAAGVVLTFPVIDDSGILYVNGREAGRANDWSQPWTFEITEYLHEGNNSIALLVHNDWGDGGPQQGCSVEPIGRRLDDLQVAPATRVTDEQIDADQHRRLLTHYAMEFQLPRTPPSLSVPWKLHLDADANAFVTLNGHLLGRYWSAGPQRDIWLPECWLNFGPEAKNVIELAGAANCRCSGRQDHQAGRSAALRTNIERGGKPTMNSLVQLLFRSSSMNRRFKKVGLIVALSLGVSHAYSQDVRLLPQDSLDTVVAKATDVRPTPRQIAWQRDEISAFIHFGMNTFTDREWGDGTEDPKLFNPTDLDARQWVRAAKSAGITRMILTAKHHDGFCLWPSKYTEHCVRNSPWKNGKGDVVGEFVDACRAEGMHYGIYISPWDRHEPTYGDSPKYNQHFLDQLREVLTTYPGIEEVWFDGACGEGPNGKRQVYDWRAYWKLIRELAPDAAITVRGPDVRWCGNEAGHTRQSEWSVIPMPGDDQSWESSDKTLSGFTP